MDESIKHYADSLYDKARMESAITLRQASTKHLQERSRTLDQRQLFSGPDYQAQVRIYVEHIVRTTAARLDSYQKAFTEIKRSPPEAELHEILNDFKATWELEIRHSSQALGKFLVGRSAPAGLDVSAELRARSAHGHDCVLREWKIWRDKVILQKSSFNSKQSEDKEKVEAISGGLDEERRFAQMAIEEARKSVPEDERQHPKVGAVVVKDGKVVSKAHRGESLKSHAEYIALEEKLSDDLVAGGYGLHYARALHHKEPS